MQYIGLVLISADGYIGRALIVIAQNMFGLSITDIAFVIYFVITDELSYK